MVDQYKVIKNRAMSSPWISRAPLGLSGNLKHRKMVWLNSSFKVDPFNHTLHIKNEGHPSASHNHRNSVQESSLLRNLNKTTLILSFPNIHPSKIEAALTLCDNNLSNCIGLLRQIQYKMHNDRKYIPGYPPQNIRPILPKPTINKNQNESFMYVPVPTKDPDVQIIEVVQNPNVPSTNNNNNFTIMEVNSDVMNILHSCNTMVLPSPLIPTTVLAPEEEIVRPSSSISRRSTNVKLPITTNYNVSNTPRAVDPMFSNCSSKVRDYPQSQNYVGVSSKTNLEPYSISRSRE